MSKIYLAAPFFNPTQVKVVEKIKALIEKYGHECYSPMHACLCPPDADAEKRKEVFEANITAIEDADCVVAVTDGKDLGTLFECGVAYAVSIYKNTSLERRKPAIYYFAQTLGDKPFNLMLAASGEAVMRSYDDLERWLETGETVDYNGTIE